MTALKPKFCLRREIGLKSKGEPKVRLKAKKKPEESGRRRANVGTQQAKCVAHRRKYSEMYTSLSNVKQTLRQVSRASNTARKSNDIDLRVNRYVTLNGVQEP